MKLLKRHIVLAPLLILILGTLALMTAPKPKAIIVVQPNSPIEIISYSADFHIGSGITRGVVTGGIVHYLQFKNRGAQRIVAISFGVLSSDVFNRFLATTAGISMTDLVPGKTERSSWITTRTQLAPS